MKAFLTGLGIGLGLGVLFAPDRGDITRKKVGERLSDWFESLSQEAENLKSAARDRVSDSAADGSKDASGLPPKKTVDRESAASAGDEAIKTGASIPATWELSKPI